MSNQTSLLQAPHRRPAPTDIPIHELIALRWSPRSFSADDVSPQELKQLFEAARWMPSAFNEQPWHFLCAHRSSTDDFSALLACLNPNNQTWAQHAAALVIAVARLELSGKAQPNRAALYDLGQAVAGMTVQATALGIAIHQMVGFDASKARASCGVPEGFEPLTAIAIGRPGAPEALPDTLRQRETAPRTRKAIDSFVFTSHWGTSSAW